MKKEKLPIILFVFGLITLLFLSIYVFIPNSHDFVVLIAAILSMLAEVTGLILSLQYSKQKPEFVTVFRNYKEMDDLRKEILENPSECGRIAALVDYSKINPKMIKYIFHLANIITSSTNEDDDWMMNRLNNRYKEAMGQILLVGAKDEKIVVENKPEN